MLKQSKSGPLSSQGLVPLKLSQPKERPAYERQVLSHLETSALNFRQATQNICLFINRNKIKSSQIISLSVHESKAKNGDPVVVLFYYEHEPESEALSLATCRLQADMPQPTAFQAATLNYNSLISMSSPPDFEGRSDETGSSKIGQSDSRAHLNLKAVNYNHLGTVDEDFE